MALLDEPSLRLAPRRIREIFDVLRWLSDEGVTTLRVEQTAAQAPALAYRGCVLERRRITLGGPTAAFRAEPTVMHAYLKRRSAGQ